MKKILLIILLIVSCSKSEYIEDVNDTRRNFLPLVISQNTTLTPDIDWILQGRTIVTDGTTLTIEPGTVIKGKGGSGTDASCLLIARGAKINAVGTVDKPIIFTSIADSTGLEVSNRGLWGGLLVLGKAPGSFKGDVSEYQIEGIPASDTRGLYGGNIPDDNSGVLKYISIRHGGTSIGGDNEINGLTLAGVGNKTIIENIEVYANVDDGIEFFGGTVNASNLIVWGQGDDGLDIDQSYAGEINNAVVILEQPSDHGLEIDGPEGSMEDSFKLKNITLIGNKSAYDGEYADFRSNAMGEISNVYAYDFKNESDVELDNNKVAENYNNNILNFNNWEIKLPEGIVDVKTLFVNKADSITTPSFGNFAKSVNVPTTGADLSYFNWTLAKKYNKF
jgi:hypothetical protein